MNVLLVEDDAETSEFVARALARERMRVTTALDCERAEAAISGEHFDVLVLDVMLPDGSGLDLCRRIRDASSAVPVLFLSARGAVSSRVEGLSAGGDDYLPKPFALRELVARVRALGRRGPLVRPNRRAIGEVALDLHARRAERKGVELPLTSREWAMLELLVAREGRVVTYDEMLETIWGESSEGARASLEVIMTRLRKKLRGGAPDGIIVTVRGYGYRFDG